MTDATQLVAGRWPTDLGLRAAGGHDRADSTHSGGRGGSADPLRDRALRRCRRGRRRIDRRSVAGGGRWVGPAALPYLLPHRAGRDGGGRAVPGAGSHGGLLVRGFQPAADLTRWLAGRAHCLRDRVLRTRGLSRPRFLRHAVPLPVAPRPGGGPARRGPGPHPAHRPAARPERLCDRLLGTLSPGLRGAAHRHARPRGALPGQARRVGGGPFDRGDRPVRAGRRSARHAWHPARHAAAQRHWACPRTRRIGLPGPGHATVGGERPLRGRRAVGTPCGRDVGAGSRDAPLPGPRRLGGGRGHAAPGRVGVASCEAAARPARARRPAGTARLRRAGWWSSSRWWPLPWPGRCCSGGAD